MPRLADIRSILYAIVFRMNFLLLEIWLSVLLTMLEPCRFLAKKYYFVLAASTVIFFFESVNNNIESFVFH